MVRKLVKYNISYISKSKKKLLYIHNSYVRQGKAIELKEMKDWTSGAIGSIPSSVTNPQEYFLVY